MSKLPIVFLLDLDSTLICPSYPLLDYLQFTHFLRDAVASKKIDLPHVRPRPMKEVVPGEFYRAGLADALRAIQAMFPTAEFFVFSAGQKGLIAAMMFLIDRCIPNERDIRRRRDPWFM